MAVGTGSLWWQVARGTEPWWCVHAQRGATEGTDGPSTGSSGPGTAGRQRGGSGSRSPGCAGAGGADSGTADLLGPAGLGCGARRRLPCPAPCLTWHPGFTRVSPLWTHSVGPQGSSWLGDGLQDGLLAFWGHWHPTVLAPKPCSGVVRGHRVLATCCPLGSPKGSLWALCCPMAVTIATTICTSSWLRMGLALRCVCQAGWVGTELRGTEDPALHQELPNILGSVTASPGRARNWTLPHTPGMVFVCFVVDH